MYVDKYIYMNRLPHLVHQLMLNYYYAQAFSCNKLHVYRPDKLWVGVLTLDSLVIAFHANTQRAIYGG